MDGGPLSDDGAAGPTRLGHPSISVYSALPPLSMKNGPGVRSKIGATGRIEFGAGGILLHVLLRGHFRVEISMSTQADKRPI